MTREPRETRETIPALDSWLRAAHLPSSSYVDGDESIKWIKGDLV